VKVAENFDSGRDAAVRALNDARDAYPTTELARRRDEWTDHEPRVVSARDAESVSASAPQRPRSWTPSASSIRRRAPEPRRFRPSAGGRPDRRASARACVRGSRGTRRRRRTRV